MDELFEKLDAARSFLGNLQYSRGSVNKPDSVATLEKIDAEIAKQEAIIQGIIDELNAMMPVIP